MKSANQQLQKGISMENNVEALDQLLEKDCYIIDFLPERVTENSDGQFFDVERYLLNSRHYSIIKDKFISVILKLMCYCHICVLWNDWIDRPEPELIENAVSEIMTDHSGTLDFLIPDENVLLVFDRDCLNLSVYNLSGKMQRLVEQIAFSEGLFCRLSE